MDVVNESHKLSDPLGDDLKKTCGLYMIYWNNAGITSRVRVAIAHYGQKIKNNYFANFNVNYNNLATNLVTFCAPDTSWQKMEK